MALGRRQWHWERSQDEHLDADKTQRVHHPLRARGRACQSAHESWLGSAENHPRARTFIEEKRSRVNDLYDPALDNVTASLDHLTQCFCDADKRLPIADEGTSGAPLAA
jgi:hypothetical protein